jgi:hypothetical protein
MRGGGKRWNVGAVKKAPSPNLQAPEKLQIPSSNRSGWQIEAMKLEGGIGCKDERIIFMCGNWLRLAWIGGLVGLSGSIVGLKRVRSGFVWLRSRVEFLQKTNVYRGTVASFLPQKILQKSGVRIQKPERRDRK